MGKFIAIINFCLVLIVLFCTNTAKANPNSRYYLPQESTTLFFNNQTVNLGLEDQLNLECLHEAYPTIVGVEEDFNGVWLVFANQRRVLYSSKKETMPYEGQESLNSDVKTSMAQIYALEPERPETPADYAPGRKRSYALFHALYGASKREVQSNLKHIRALNSSWMFTQGAAQAFLAASQQISEKIRQNPQLRFWLKGNGSFCWRKIAGEDVLSPHSFGIAFDIGAGHGATYWRWSKQRPHPLQKTYPSEIVASFEDAGFIWGGKWHEFDLMHFEYRPELICKARRLKTRTIDIGQDRLAKKVIR